MRTSVVAIAAAMLVTGCAPHVEVMRYQPGPFPPSEAVEVLTEAPSYPYEAIAELTVAPGKNAVLALRSKAQEIGADAIILMGESTIGAVALPMGTGIMAAPVKRIKALAIRGK